MFIELGTIASDKFATPSITVNVSSGKRRKNVLILTQHQVVDDKGEKHYPTNVLWNAQADTLINIVKHIKEYEKQKLPATLFVVDVPDDEIDAGVITNINKFIKKNDIDIVLCAGFSTAANFVKHTPWRCSQLRGRILRSHKLDVPLIPTFPIRQVMSEDKRDWKSHINLLGFFKEDLTTAIRGKNLYTINTDIKYKSIDTLRKWKKFYKKLRKSKYCAIDTEGKNLNRRFGNELYIIQFSIKPDFAYILPYKHRLTPFSKKELEIIRSDLQEYFETADHATLLTQNGKFDLTIFMSLLGVRFLAPKIYDTSVGEYFLDENRKYMWQLRVYDSPVGMKVPQSLKTISGYSLETLVAQYSGRFPYDDSTIGKADRIYLNNYTFEEYAPYCARDVIYLWRIMDCQITEARRRGGFYNRFLVNVTDLGAAMLHIFVEMEYNGVLIDREYLKKTILPNSIAAQEVIALKKKLYEFPNVIKANNRMLKEEKHQGITVPLLAKKPWVFNIDVQHDQQVLFIDVLKIPILKRRKNGDASIDAKFFENFKVYPEVETLDAIRELKTLFNTHLKGNLRILQNSPDCKDSRLRSNYDFLGVVTSRTSSSEPALQQIPQHTENAKIIKRAFIAGFLGILLDVDYNAHEVRIWGNLSRDKIMAKAFVIGMKIRRQIRIWQAEDFDRANAAYAYLEKIEWFREKDDKVTGKKALLMPEREKIARKLPKDIQQLAYLLIELLKNGDVHKKNYEFFFGVPAAEVTKPQRQSVKQTIFGSMYGKCLIGNSLVVTSGGIFTLKELYQKYGSSHINKNKSKVASHIGHGNFNYVMKTKGKTWKVVSNLDDEAIGLPEHRLWGINSEGKLDFIRLDHLKPGMFITKSVGTNIYSKEVPNLDYLITKNYRAFASIVENIPKKLTNGIAMLFGLFVAEGDTCGRFCNHDNFLLDEFSRLLKKEFGADRKANYRGHVVSCDIILTDFFNYHLGGLYSAYKTVPLVIRQAPKRMQVEFIKGLFEGDGTIYQHQSSWLLEYNSSSFTLVYQLKIMLENMGVLCKIIERQSFASNTVNKTVSTTWCLRVINQDIKNFFEVAGFYPDRLKQQTLKIACKEMEASFAENKRCNALGVYNLIPPNSVLKNLIEELDKVCKNTVYKENCVIYGKNVIRKRTYKLGALTGSTHTQLKIKNGKPITRHSYEIFKQKINKAPPALKKAIKNNTKIQTLLLEIDNIAKYRWVTVKHSQKTNKTEDVYDLGVPGKNSYHVNGFIGHNTAPSLGEELNAEEVRQIKLANLNADRQELNVLLQPYHEMGRDLIDKMFSTFHKGYDWIIDRQNEAQTFMRTASPIGPVRHIWGYFFNHRTLLNRMDRLASNSINQGLASNLGYIGARQFQIVKFMALKAGINFHTKIVNSVHDSLKNEVTNIVNLPFVLYYLEHSLMTQTAKVSKEVYNFPFFIGLEAEFELGPYGSDMTKYGFTEYSFFNIIHKWIATQESNFNREIKGKKYLLQYLKDSYRFVETYRAKELAKVDSFEPETRVLLTLDKVKTFQENSRAYHKFIQCKQ